MITGISGKIGSGKDTVGQIIQYLQYRKTFNIEIPISEKNFEIFRNSLAHTDQLWKIKKFADSIKDTVCLWLGCTREQLEDREFKEKELGEEWKKYFVTKRGFTTKHYINKSEIEKYSKSTDDLGKDYLVQSETLTPRKILQLLGTECGRNIIHPNIWCNSLFSDYYGDIEEWKDINEYIGLYQISSFGNVRSLDREVIYGNKIKGEYHNRKGQLLKPTLSGGYETVSLSGKTFTVHSLVGEHFLNKSDKDFVLNHKDYNKTNNFYKNLEYVSQGDNVRHNYLTGNANIGIKQKGAKLSDNLVLQIKDWLFSGKYSNSEIAKRMNVSPTTISDIKKGKKWKHVGKKQIKIEPILPKLSPKWIITDVRFPNETAAIKSKGGILIRVNRFTEEQNIAFAKVRAGRPNNSMELLFKEHHPSETALDNYEFDHVIGNNGTIEELIEKVTLILKQENIL